MQTLRDSSARKAAALQTARLALDGAGGKVTFGAAEPSKAEVQETIARIEEYLGDVGLEEVADAPSATRAQQTGAPKAPPPKPSAPSKPPSGKPSPKSRGGKRASGGTGDEPGKQKNRQGKQQGEGAGNFEKQHPRGRGGVWIKKGEGTQSAPSQNVAQAQRRLVQLGYGPGAADGVQGPLFKGAVQKFQADYGLSPTGEVDPATAQIMANPPAQKVAEIQAQNAALAAVPNAQGQVATPAGAGGGHAAAPAGAHAAAPGAAPAGAPAATAPAAAGAPTAPGAAAPGAPNAPAANAPAQHAAAARPKRKGGAGAQKGTQKGAGAQVIGEGEGLNGTPSASVKGVQNDLQTLGYDLGKFGPDGRFGPYTDRAVRKLQREHGLKADGKIGRRTKRLIKRLVARQGQVAKAKGVVQSADEQILQAFVTKVDRLQRRIEEARGEALIAEHEHDPENVVRWRAVEQTMRQKLEEAVDPENIDEGLLAGFEGRLHPRDRTGRFRDVLAMAKQRQTGKSEDGSLLGKTVEFRTARSLPGNSARSPYGVVTRDQTKNNPFVSVTTVERKGMGRRHGHGVAATYSVYASDAHVVGRRRKVREALAERFDEATAERLAAQESGDTAAFTTARAMERAMAEQIVGEADANDLDLTQARAAVMLGHGAARRVLAEADSCALPHESMSRKGMKKCPKCGASIGKLVKTEVKEANVFEAIEETALSRDDHRTIVRFFTGREWEQIEENAAALDAQPPFVLVEADAPDSRSLPDLPNKPGKTNWVEKAGGLPSYINRIAKHLKAKGKDTSQAIAIAVNVAKKMCASGDTNFPGTQQVNAKSRAEACKAVAEWERKKASH